MESDYDRWQEDNLYLFTGSGWCYPDNNKPEKNYTREEAIEFEKTNKYEREDVNWTDEEEVNEILRENEFYDYEYFWNSDNDRRSGNVPVRNECYGWRS